MKVLVFTLAVLVGMVTCDLPGPPQSMDSAMDYATFSYEKYLDVTCNETSTQDVDYKVRGCCPYIVRPGPKGSVIQPFSGYRGNVAIIVDWGSPWNQGCNWRRNCTTQDTGFVYFVDWGDGSHSFGRQDHLGPFQVAHQYAKYCNSYGVKATYCSTPSRCSCAKRCCSSLYKVIDVSFDPQDCRCHG